MSQKVIEKFISLCNSYAESNDEILSYEVFDESRVCRFVAVYPLIKLEFRYIKKPKSLENPSTLYCVVYLNKNSDIYYHMTDIIPYLENKDFRCPYFSSIENVERMEACFYTLVDIVGNCFTEIQGLALDDTKVKNSLFGLYKNFYKLKETHLDFSKVENKKEFDHDYFLDLQKKRDKVMLLRFTTASGYTSLLRGKRNKAIKFYEKWEKDSALFEYEKQLLDFLKSSESKAFEFIPEECNSQVDVNNYNNFFSGVIAVLKLFVVFGIIFCAGFALYNYIAARNTVFTITAPFLLGLMPAALCALFGTIAFYRYIPDKKFKSGKKQEIHKTLNSKATRTAAVVCFVVVFIASVFLSTMMIRCDIRFYNENMSFTIGDFSIRHQPYEYSEIDGVYYISARYNYLDERIERPSYLILFNDKTVLDLDGYTTVEYSEEKVLPFLESKGFSVNRVDSDKDLPSGYDYY